MHQRRGFTLIELLVVISIIAILSVVVVLTLNPSEMLRRSRDSNRLSDLDSLTHAISLYQTDQGVVNGTGSLGSSTIIYISLPDPTLSGNATSTCTSLGLPAAPTGYQYQCSSPQSFRSITGTGWIPINFNAITTGSPLGQLPIDPTNASSSGLYYTYVTNGSQYEVASLFESNLNKAQYASNPIVPDYPEVDAKGSNLTINPLWSTTGLVGYWPLTEGTGTTAYDASGNGDNGTWNGTPAYTAGKVGSYAASFSGGNFINVPSSSVFTFGTGNFSISLWVYLQSTTNFEGLVGEKAAPANAAGYAIYYDGGAGGSSQKLMYSVANGAANGQQYTINTIGSGAWHHVVMVANSSDPNYGYYYIDGVKQILANPSQNLNTTNSNNVNIGNQGGYPLNGYINDVRFYNRALSAAEIMALYNAEK